MFFKKYLYTFIKKKYYNDFAVEKKFFFNKKILKVSDILKLNKEKKINKDALNKIEILLKFINQKKFNNLEKKRIFKLIKSINYKELNFKMWLHIKNFFILRGFFQISILCTNNALKNLKYEKVKIYNIEYILSYCLLKNDKKKLLEIKKSFWSFLFRYQISLITKLMSKISGENNKFDLENELKINRKYLSLIQNKNISLLGPQNIPKKEIARIAKKDEVIAMNYCENYSKYINKLISISYYSGRLLNFILNENITIQKYNLKFVSASSTLNFDNFKIYRQDNILLYARPHNLQSVIFDLIIYEPRKIDIMGVDFFTSKNLYQKNYLSTKFENFDKNLFENLSEQFCYSFCIHDVLQNFKIMKILYKKKLINFDQKTKKIIKLNELEYLKKVEKVWSKNL